MRVVGRCRTCFVGSILLDDVGQSNRTQANFVDSILLRHVKWSSLSQANFVGFRFANSKLWAGYRGWWQTRKDFLHSCLFVAKHFFHTRSPPSAHPAWHVRRSCQQGVPFIEHYKMISKKHARKWDSHMLNWNWPTCAIEWPSVKWHIWTPFSRASSMVHQCQRLVGLADSFSSRFFFQFPASFYSPTCGTGIDTDIEWGHNSTISIQTGIKSCTSRIVDLLGLPRCTAKPMYTCLVHPIIDVLVTEVNQSLSFATSTIRWIQGLHKDYSSSATDILKS